MYLIFFLNWFLKKIFSMTKNQRFQCFIFLFLACHFSWPDLKKVSFLNTYTYFILLELKSAFDNTLWQYSCLPHIRRSGSDLSKNLNSSIKEVIILHVFWRKNFEQKSSYLPINQSEKINDLCCTSLVITQAPYY